MTLHAPENGASACPSTDTAGKVLRCTGEAKRTGRQCQSWPLTGGTKCFTHAAESPEDAHGEPVVTRVEKHAAVVRGGLQATRRGPAAVDVEQAVTLRIDTLEEIRAFRTLLLAEIREKVWSHGDAALQLHLLAEARRGAVDLEKLKLARATLVRGRRTTSLVRVSLDPAITALANLHRRSQPRVLELPARAPSEFRATTTAVDQS